MFRNKKIISILLTVIMVLTVAIPALAAPVDYGAELANKPNKSYSQIFTDVPPSHWAFSYIGEMADRGVLSGYPNGYFYPENPVTRGEFAKIMTLASGLPPAWQSESSYADVSPDDWYSPYIETARHYLSGYVINGQSYYMPNITALREDIAVALVKLKGYDTNMYDLSILQAMFKDWQSISEGAQKYVAIAVEKGLISGYEDNTFRGQDGVNRAETATLLWRAYQYGNGNKDFEQGETEDTNSPSPTTLPDVMNDLQLTMYVGESVKQVMDEQKFSQSISKYGQRIYESDVAENDGCLEKRPNIHNLVYAINLYFAVKPGKAVLYTPMEDASGNYFSLKTTVNVLAAKPENPTEEPGKPTEPTKEPVSKKAYTVDTLAKASVSDTYKYATDDGQNLYYYDCKDNTVYKINMDSGKKSTLLNVSNLKYEEMETTTETVTKTVEKQVPKTITKEVEKEVPIEDTDNVTDEDALESAEGETVEKPNTQTVIETVEETIYETVTEEITEEVTKETLKGTYTDYEVQQVYYNTGNDMLLLTGQYTKFQSVKSHNKQSAKKYMHYDITNGKAALFSDMNFDTKVNYSGHSHSIRDVYAICGNMDNGKLLWNIQIYYYNDNIIDYPVTAIIDLKNASIDSVLLNHLPMTYSNGNNIYRLNITESYHFREYYFGNIEKYNFSKKEWEPQWDDKIHFVLYGIKNKNTYLWDIDAGHITIIASDGTPQKTNINLKENLTVLDFLDMPTNYTYDKFSGNRDYRRMFITKNESFIFYDSAAGAWRKIAKQ